MSRKVMLLALTTGSALLLGGCELGWKESKQTGYRGAGLAQVSNTDLKLPEDNIPEPLTPLLPDDGGPRASSLYPGLQELGGLSVDEFNRLMGSMTQWIAPAEQGCAYCHNPENMASDEKYTFGVARKMIQMTRQINGQWANHVKATGVTCYTCHRGNAVPEYKWSMAAGGGAKSPLGNRNGQNSPDPNVGYASLPFDPFASYLQGKTAEIRVASSSAFPSKDWKPSIQETEGSYGLMMHLSSALGVNCTYCHNSQSFRAWNESTPQRALAFYGIRMVRDINENYITPLKPVFPANRVGPMGDPYKVNCATCHQGKAKPLGGVAMLKDHPALGPVRTPAMAATPVPSQLTAPAVGGQ